MFNTELSKVTGLLSGRSMPMADETLVEEARTVALRDATAVRASLELGVGELAIGGGASTLLAADFAYNAPDWRPELSYDEQQGQGELSLVYPR